MIAVEQLYFSFNKNLVLKNLSFTVSEGEFVGILGPNGAGKSTLLKILDRILDPDSGRVFIFRKNLVSYTRRSLAKKVGFVPQLFSTTFNFSAFDIVMMGRFPHQKFFGYQTREDFNSVEMAMQATDCISLKDRSFHTLSIGEQNRVVLASALAQNPKILLLDEATTALDLNHQVQFYEILKKLQKEQGLTILSVTHDVNLAAQFCSRIIALKNGKILADNLVSNLFKKQILEELYNTPVEILIHPQSGLPLVLPVLDKY
jgi:iron complex transport system ATP-binding protein